MIRVIRFRPDKSGDVEVVADFCYFMFIKVPKQTKSRIISWRVFYESKVYVFF